MDFVDDIWLWLGFCFVIGIIAKNFGRSFWKYFFLSFFLSPLIGFLVVIISGKKDKEPKVIVVQQDTSPSSQSASQSHTVNSSDKMKYCSACGALLTPNANFCSNCGCDLGKIYTEQ